jgi:hypothetical protein
MRFSLEGSSQVITSRFGSRILLSFAVAAVLMAARRPASAGPTLTTPQADAPGTRAFCSVNYPAMPYYNKAQPTYYTAIFPFREEVNYGALFAEYVRKKYSIQQFSGGSCTHSNGSLSGLETAMETQIGKAKEFGAASVVRTDWTFEKHEALMAELAKNPPAQKAPAAQKSATNAAPAATAAASPGRAAAKSAPPPPAAQPAPQGPAKYSYCYAYGTPAGRSGNVKQNFYITQPFQVESRIRLNEDFESFLGSAHAGETISASCLSPGPLETAQANRQQALTNRRKQPAQFAVVEVDWKR